MKSHNITELSESELAELRGKTIGFIFQQYNLIPSITAYDNVILPLEFLEVNEKEASERSKKTLESVGLKEKMYNRPTQLSGGEQQRVSIARCLVTNPDIILADEPTEALDSVTGQEVIETLCRLWKDEGKTVIMVTHDLHLAQYAHTHVELKDGQVIEIRENNPKKVFDKGG